VNRYICPACGKACYSAASLDNATDPRCPYCDVDMRAKRTAPDVENREAANQGTAINHKIPQKEGNVKLPNCCSCGKPVTCAPVICKRCLDELRAINSAVAESSFETFINGGVLCIVLARDGCTALIARMIPEQPSFVVPLEHRSGETDWWQGHYFSSLGDAWDYYKNRLKEKNAI